MTTIITLTDLVIKKIDIDYENQSVRVVFSLVDAGGREWDTRVAIFWVTLPEVAGIYDFQLSSTYLPTLVSLRNDADIALTARFLV